MPELYTVPSGQDDPNLPPLNLPSLDTAEAPQAAPLRITVGRVAKPKEEQAPWEALPDQPPAPGLGAAMAPRPAAAPPAAEAAAPWEALPDTPPERQPTMGAGEAALTGAKHGLTFGFQPAISGLAEAAGEPGRQALEQEAQAATEGVPGAAEAAGGAYLAQPIIGAARMLHNWFSDHPDPSIKEAYDRGRQQALTHEKQASEEHKWAYLGGQLAGALATPGFGAARAGSVAARAGYGALGGMIGGGLYGVGEATSEAAPPTEIAKRGAIGGAVGGALGGGIGAAIGPRVAPGVIGPAGRAAQTAESLGAPLPRGLASESPALQATTAKSQAFPLVGHRIGESVRQTAAAAGESLGDISAQMAGGTPERAIADALVRPGLRAAVDTNRQTIDAGYNALRGQIDQNARFTMPRTDAVLTDIMRTRHEAGWQNPAQGLEQWRTVAGGATFNGAHRARADARSAGDVLSPHPGYDAHDFNRLTAAMTADLREMAQGAATSQTPQGRAAALAAFDAAERQFGPLAEQNRLLSKLANAQGEGAIAKALGAAKEKGGNLRLLAQLRQTMPPQDFEQIGATLLHETGFNPTTNAFSLGKFATDWAKISDGAKRVLFAPDHLAHIEDVAQLGQHLKGALRETNTSHTANVLVMMDLARDAILMTAAGIAGTLTGTTGLAVAGAGAGAMLVRWLSNPARAASISAWQRAYRAATLGQPTPARVAAFKIATRNLANTLGLPVEQVTDTIGRRLGAIGQPLQPDDRRELGVGDQGHR